MINIRSSIVICLANMGTINTRCMLYTFASYIRGNNLNKYTVFVYLALTRFRNVMCGIQITQSRYTLPNLNLPIK